MGQYNLDRIMKPRQVAVVGASERTGSIGNALMVNLLHGGFPCRIFPVNLKHRNVYGYPAYRSVAELDSGVDLAIIATPIHTVPKIIEECVERKIGGAIVISAGGKEVGESGIEIEEKIDALVRATGLRIIGPNCLGMIRPKEKLNASFVSGMAPVGSLAFVSQSGAICSALLEIALVAIDEDKENERILGVARIIGDPDGRKGEFAVLVSDAWQGKGIGSAPLQKCLLIAEQRGFEHVHGIVLQENINMLAMEEKIGFTIDRGGEGGEYELQITFDRSGKGCGANIH